jgi:hypothetical protein
MAQTANKKKQQPAIERYNRLLLVKQRLTWLYYHGENTNNQEGLSPEGVVGGIIDYRIAGTIKQYITADKFAYQAKVRYNSFIIRLLSCVLSFHSLIFVLVLFNRKPAKSL